MYIFNKLMFFIVFFFSYFETKFVVKYFYKFRMDLEMSMEKSYSKLVESYMGSVKSALHKKIEGISGIDVQRTNELLIDKRQKIYEFLKREGNKNIEVNEKLLENKFGSPERMAEYILYELENTERLCLFPYEGVWLGVCAGVAKKIGVKPFWVRASFVLLGIMLGVGLILYLFLFFYLYENSRRIQVILRVNMLKILLGLSGTVVLTLCVFLGFRGIVMGLYYLYVVYVGVMKETDWLEWAKVLAKKLTIAMGYASAVFSLYASLPLMNGWDETFRNLKNAVMALFVFFIFIDLVYILSMFVITSFKALVFEV